MNNQLLEVYLTWIHSQEDSDFEAFINLGVSLYGAEQFSNMLNFFHTFTSVELYDALTTKNGAYKYPITVASSANE